MSEKMLSVRYNTGSETDGKKWKQALFSTEKEAEIFQEAFINSPETPTKQCDITGWVEV